MSYRFGGVNNVSDRLLRVKDWIHGVRSAAPEKETRKALESDPLYEAERLRIIYQLITNSKAEGGAGITPKQGEWTCVESIFALHDHDYNKQWIKEWTSSYFVKPQQLDDIRNRLGEQVRLYHLTPILSSAKLCTRLPTTLHSPSLTLCSLHFLRFSDSLLGSCSAISLQFTLS